MADARAPEKASYQLALKILLSAGSILECDRHPGVYFRGRNDIKLTYSPANNRITAYDIELSTRANLAEFVDILKSVYVANSSRDDCCECDEQDFGGHS